MVRGIYKKCGRNDARRYPIPVNAFSQDATSFCVYQLQCVPVKKRKKSLKYPIAHWSYSSLMAYLRNPLAWHKRYVEKVYDTPATPASIIGRAGHVALQHFYSGMGKEASVALGLEYMRRVADFEIDFGVRVVSAKEKRVKRLKMEGEYLQALSFYLARPPRHKVVGIEFSGMAEVEGLPLPIKAISDLVVESREDANALDIVDHKFVDSFSRLGKEKPLFILQAIFNFYTVREGFGKPVKRFILQECKKKKNKDGGSQMRRHVIRYDELEDEFALFQRLMKDATADIATRKVYLPNPSDMFEGKNSFDIYRLGL